MELQPEYPAVLHNMALSCMDLKMFDRAERLLKRALHQKEAFHQAHYNLGNLYKELNHKERALQQFRAAVQQDAQQPVYHHALALLLQEMVYRNSANI